MRYLLTWIPVRPWFIAWESAWTIGNNPDEITWSQPIWMEPAVSR